MLLWGQPLMKLFVLIVSPSVSFLFEITIVTDEQRGTSKMDVVVIAVRSILGLC